MKNFEKNITENWFFCIINRTDIIITRVRESRQKHVWNLVLSAHMSWRLLRTNTKLTSPSGYSIHEEDIFWSGL